MKKLGELILGGIPFAIHQGSPSENHNLETNQGYCNHEREEIWLRDTLSAAGFFDTLVHEVMHALLENSGASQFLKGCLLPTVNESEVEETLVRVLTPHLANAILQLGKLKQKK